MSRLLTTLQSRLVKVQARIIDIETHYPHLIKIKSYGRNFNATTTTYQEFGAVGKEYRDLLNDEERISNQLDQLENTTGGSYLADFRPE